MSKWYSLPFTLFLYISDLLLVVASLLVASVVRLAVEFGKPVTAFNTNLPVAVYVMAVVIWAITYVVMDVYNPKRSTRLVSEMQTLVVATAFAFMVLTGALYFSYRDVSRLQVLYFGVFFVTFITTHRIAVRSFFWLRGGRRFDTRRVLILGTDAIARDVAEMVVAHAWTGLRLVGFAGPTPADDTTLDAPVLGSLADTLSLVEKHQVDEVVIALPADSQHQMAALTYALQSLPVNLRVVPDYFDLAFLQVRVEDFGGMPLLSLKEPTLSPFQRLTKRVFDLILTLLLLPLALIVMAVVAVMVRRDSPGKALFKQERIGESGQPFMMYKFRTMFEDAHQDDEGDTQIDYTRYVEKSADDPRVTHIGHVLRRFSLDELPQLFNVLRGEMSLVGPRPEMPYLVNAYEPWQRKRFDVPQGMTGWWQINGRSDKAMHLHTDEDLFYIRNYSLWLDIQILWRTLGVVIRGQGAY